MAVAPTDTHAYFVVFRVLRPCSLRSPFVRGVLVVVGTDNIQGVLPLEIANLVDAGFSPLEAISAATGIAARVMGIDNEVGTIERGKFADLIAVDGRPDEDIEDLFGPVFIMVGGRDFSRLSFR